MSNWHCLTCNKRLQEENPRYFVLPGSWYTNNSYLLCDDHSDLSYRFEDIYDYDEKKGPKRKKIDHEAVIVRCRGER